MGVTTVKITTVGNSAGIILPKEVLAKLHLEKGDELYITDSPDGVRLTPYDPSFGHKLEVMEQIMRENRDVLKKLAK